MREDAQNILSPQARRKALETRFPVWEPVSISGALDRATLAFAERPLIITESRSWSYAEVQDWSSKLASGLITHGLKTGEHVALIMANYPEYTALKFAIARAGAICVPINFMLRGQELAYVLAQSGSVMLIMMDEFRGQDYCAELAGIKAELDNLRHIFLHPTATPEQDGASLDMLMQSGTAVSDAELAERETVQDGMALSDIIYTSGTTGRSKGVMLTHDMVLRAAFSSAVHRAFEDGRRIQFALPMYHVFGYVECLIAALFVGGAIIPQLVFDAAETLDLAERQHASELVCVPMMTQKLIDLARTRGFDSRALCTMFNSGGTNAPSIWGEIRTVLGPREVVTAYGMTETTASTTCTLPEGDDRHLLTSNGCLKWPSVAGDPAIGGRVALYKVIDPETGADLPYGAEGELVAQGPVVTRGYYNKPDETAAAFTSDGWLRTGDLGRIDDQGYLTLTGRIKEAYRCGGEMVMPREVEALFEGHPHIAQALVVGIADPKMGEIGCLCIVPRGEELPSADALIAHCAAQLARFKVPRHVLVFQADDIPLTVTGRPQKFKLATLAAARIASQQGD
jgi:fatty-acyl-CoA synthase